MLPLIPHMPVAMTDHIDRSVDKIILRGRVGHIHSWMLHENKDSVFENGICALHYLPEVVFVQFKTSQNNNLKWKPPGLNENALYPIVPTDRQIVFLDTGRPHPILGITRRQLPFAPAFARTAHSAQGQTFDSGAIVDLSIGGSSSAMSSYVALTRVQTREDLLINRPFERQPFNRGQKPGL